MSEEFNPSGGSVTDAVREGYQGRRPALETDDGRSLGEVLGDVASNLSTLMRQEVALAKAEVRQSGTQAGKGIGLFAGAGIGGLMFLGFVSTSAWWGLGQFMGKEWSALIVAIVWAIVAGVLFLKGKHEFARIRGLEQTTETLSKVPGAIKGQGQEM
ncbi:MULTISPECIES: phage holin family protein [Aestuariimicrobium]|uniref:phage holin family protein n=1 Tax=Aestuariimicrobium TaxID=396388 RepID=UPI0003B36189|nr:MULTISPECIES: phage holin family protein [Aestuariimicrobium]CAI9403899.1 hypothetical protein AESSP_01097 [Aestuariimicrobium sp. T2.26MG-19.2B]